MERSQLRNKEIALEMLKNKLYILNQKEFNDKIKDLKGQKRVNIIIRKLSMKAFRLRVVKSVKGINS